MAPEPLFKVDESSCIYQKAQAPADFTIVLTEEILRTSKSDF
jgi:hypothetical protein